MNGLPMLDTGKPCSSTLTFEVGEEEVKIQVAASLTVYGLVRALCRMYFDVKEYSHLWEFTDMSQGAIYLLSLVMDQRPLESCKKPWRNPELFDVSHISRAFGSLFKLNYNSLCSDTIAMARLIAIDESFSQDVNKACPRELSESGNVKFVNYVQMPDGTYEKVLKKILYDLILQQLHYNTTSSVITSRSVLPWQHTQLALTWSNCLSIIHSLTMIQLTKLGGASSSTSTF